MTEPAAVLPVAALPAAVVDRLGEAVPDRYGSVAAVGIGLVNG